MSNMMRFSTGLNNFRNEPGFKVLVEAETGKPGKITLLDAETLDGIATILLPPGAAMNLSSAFGLVASMEQEQLKDDMLGRGQS